MRETPEDTVQLLVVTPEILAGAWTHIERLLLTYREGWEDKMDLSDIYHSLVAGNYQFWMANDADEFFLGMLTSTIAYPKKKTMQIIWMGGDRLHDALPLLDYIEIWAARRGIESVEVGGRAGWVRTLRPLGYEELWRTVVKDISSLTEP